MSPKQSLSTSLDSHEWGKDRFDAGRYEQCKNLIAEHGCVSTIIRRLRPLGGVKEPPKHVRVVLHPWLRLGPEAPHAP